ncbi:hypothetical protein CBOM_05718 [Ceraceosorus bombacis]|uniref:Uncharacterized protein n=1 Tax=Ceraceosorus bombacis TaxID=401625 RepID=A0A0P1BQ46_9BASI|nr:hypothetical protein CBOM_05718 [Ceraceosorus bombacis]
MRAQERVLVGAILHDVHATLGSPTGRNHFLLAKQLSLIGFTAYAARNSSNGRTQLTRSLEHTYRSDARSSALPHPCIFEVRFLWRRCSSKIGNGTDTQATESARTQQVFATWLHQELIACAETRLNRMASRPVLQLKDAPT